MKTKFQCVHVDFESGGKWCGNVVKRTSHCWVFDLLFVSFLYKNLWTVACGGEMSFDGGGFTWRPAGTRDGAVLPLIEAFNGE